MYKIICMVKFNEGVQVVFDDIEDFERFNKERKDTNHKIRGYVKSIKCEVAYIDEYNTGNYEWYVVGGCFLNYLEPLCFHPLEDYITA